MDIEGTTSSISFVHQVLFPYSAKRLPSFLKEQEAVVNAILGKVRETISSEKNVPEKKITLEDCETALLDWIKSDRKHPALKEIQGLIWREGYESGAYRGHVYPDVPKVWEIWKARGLGMGIYSSGSVDAQKQIFGFSEAGDLTPYLNHFFDTRVGAKREVASYAQIAGEVKLSASEILFLSDIPAELDAAKMAGMAVVHLVRPGTQPGTIHPVAHDFLEVDVLLTQMDGPAV